MCLTWVGTGQALARDSQRKGWLEGRWLGKAGAPRVADVGKRALGQQAERRLGAGGDEQGAQAGLREELACCLWGLPPAAGPESAGPAHRASAS